MNDRPRSVISIEKHVPFLACNVDPDNLVPSWQLLTSRWSSGSLQTDYHNLIKLHPLSELACSELPLSVLYVADGNCRAYCNGHQYIVEKLVLYTDGSHTSLGSSWAVVGLARLYGRDVSKFLTRFGHFGGLVVTDSYRMTYIGAKNGNSYTGELCALTWAFAFASQSHLQVPFEVHYDCVSAAKNASGEWGGKCETQLIAVSQACLLAARSKSPLTLHHCKGHSGNPYNELVDAVARSVCHNVLPPLFMPFPARPITRAESHRVSWAALLAFGYLNKSYMPPIRDSVMIITAGDAPRCPPFLQPIVESNNHNIHRRKHSVRATVIPAIFVQFNALTLHETARKYVKDEMQSRAVYLDSVFNEIRATFVALEETRNRSPSSRSLPNYVTVGSACTSNGTHGIELWIAREIAIDKQHVICVTPKHVVIVFQSPRVLLVAIRTGVLTLDVLVIHAVHRDSKHSLVEVEAFWTDLDPVLALRSIPLAPLVCLADINGRLGSVECASVGSHGATQETVTGAHFRKMCNKNRIFVPSTFPELHTGQTSTWLSPQDKLYRIDFGAFPIEWRTHQFESFVDTELDVVHNRRDHFPLVTRCSIVSTFEQTVIVRKKPIVSRDAIKDPVAVADFKYNMNQIPFCHWTSHSHDHHYNTFKLLQNAASATFPLVVNVPNKSWIGP